MWGLKMVNRSKNTEDYTKQARPWYKTWKIIPVIWVALSIIFAASSSTQRTTQTTTSDIQQAAQDKIKADQEAKALADKRQDTISSLAPAYCKTHGDLRVNEPTLSQQGWPHANNSLGLSGEECVAIIGRLYDQGTTPQKLQTMSEDKVAVGMSKVEVVYTWGSPGDINTTTSLNTTQDQWVYGSPAYGATYVYFVNDVVTTIQN